MTKNFKVTCPYCRSKEHWFIHTKEDVNVFQCIECNMYFKVKAVKAQVAQ